MANYKEKMAVITDSLTYVLPSSLLFSLLQFTCTVLNNHPNSNFPFATPHIILHGTHNGYSHFPHNIPLPFGTIVRSLERARTSDRNHCRYNRQFHRIPSSLLPFLQLSTRRHHSIPSSNPTYSSSHPTLQHGLLHLINRSHLNFYQQLMPSPSINLCSTLQAHPLLYLHFSHLSTQPSSPSLLTSHTSIHLPSPFLTHYLFLQYFNTLLPSLSPFHPPSFQ